MHPDKSKQSLSINPLVDLDPKEVGNQDPFAGIDLEDTPVEVRPTESTDVSSAPQMAPPADFVVSTVEESFNRFDDTTSRTQSIRQILLNKLVPVIEDFELSVSNDTDAELYQAQAKMIDQTRQILNDMDNSSKNHTTLKLKQASLNEEHQANVNIAEILSKVKLTQAATWSVMDANNPVLKNEQELNDVLKKLTQDEIIAEEELQSSTSKLPKDKLNSDV